MTQKRKRRSDRNHIIYQLTVRGKIYIGVTVKDTNTALQSLRRRVGKHWYRRKEVGKNHWILYREIAKLETRNQIDAKILEIVRGKSEAHMRERELIRMHRPVLNSDKRGC